MKKYSILLFTALLVLNSCSSSRQQIPMQSSLTSNSNSTSTKKQTKETEENIFGKVVSIHDGKDGYVAIIETKNNKSYKALISIPNLGRHGGYTDLKVGNNVAVFGSVWEMDNHRRITVKKILSENTNHFKLKGIVEEIKNEKDGYTAKIRSNDLFYYATISIPNLGENHANFRMLEKGEKVHIYGELWFMNDKKQITVRDILK
ncbi:hypothetical protein [Aureivirga sp. CE67]|uniref:hypothetical protein n=1 Tax=Aureivirga sp. CE67 TaxID=1788983 RepID=UPI0018CAB307|nr:hypothetical protein [Aureivirga sp. CE67]